MSKRFLIAACIFGITVLATSCRRNVLKGTGDKTTTTPTVASFNAVEVDIPLGVDITVNPSNQPGVQLSGYTNVINHIKTKIDNNTLIIYTDLDETWTIDGNGIGVQITLPALTDLSLDGAADANVHGSITGGAFDVDVSGASTIVLDNVNVDSFSIDISGAGDLKIKGGAVKYAEYEVDGAAKVQAYPLQAAFTSASINGAGTGEFTALSRLEADISGAGTIRYKGHPVISQSVSGAGTIKDAN